MKKFLLVLIFAVFAIPLFSSCTIGPGALFIHPSDNGYEFCVVYDGFGGTINTLEKREAYYIENSLIYKPQGASGMLVAPKNGSKLLVGWYTDYEKDLNGDIHFKEEDMWDFESDRITKENTLLSKNEKDSDLYILNLYANWIESPSIEFVDSENHENILLKWNPTIGKDIERPTTTEPKKAGHALIDYYYDPECTEKVTWGAGGISLDSIIDGTAESSTIYVYCKFIEGEYTRIKSVNDFNNMKSNTGGNYILANDVNFAGAEWQNATSAFKGTFLGNGYSILNITIKAQNKVSGINSKKNTEASFGLFGSLKEAQIYDLTFKDATLLVDSTSNSAICVGAVAGRASDSKIINCSVDGLQLKTSAQSKVDVTAAALVFADESCEVTGSNIENANSDGLETTGIVLVDFSK